MSETTDKSPEVKAPDFSNIVIDRNGVSLPMTAFKILKGKRANSFYPAPKIEVGNLQATIDWIGEANIVNELQTLLKRKFQNITVESTPEDTGVFDEALFAKYAADFTSAGMKLKEINDKLDELQAQLTRLIDAGDFATSEVKMKELTDLNSQVRAYRQMKEDKQRKPKTEEDEEPSVAA